MNVRNIIKYSIILIGIILMSLILWFGDEAMKADEDLQKYIVQPFILTGGILSILGLLLTIVYYVINLVENFNPKILYILGGGIILFITSYFLASNDLLGEDITATASKQVGAGFITFYFLIFGAIGAILYTELSKVFSK